MHVIMVLNYLHEIMLKLSLSLSLFISDVQKSNYSATGISDKI